MEARILGREDILEQARRILPRLSAGDIRAAVRKHLDPGAFFLAVVAPKASALRDGLLNGAAEDDAGVPAFPLGLRPEAVRVVTAESLIRSAWPPVR